MRKMMLSRVSSDSLAFGSFLMIIAPLAACSGFQPDSVCHARSVPHDSAVTSTDGFFYFVYPSKIGPKYSGCQSMWDEHGKLVSEVLVDRGVIVEYRSFDGSAGLVCKYQDGRLANEGPQNECPAYEDVREGFKVMDADELPEIPKGRDPRVAK